MEQLKSQSEALKTSLLQLQSDLDKYVKATEILVDGQTIPFRFFNRVNVGIVTNNFSELAKSIFELEGKLEQALAAQQAELSAGESSES